MGCPGSILKTVARHEMRATALRRGKSSSYCVRDCGAKIDFSVVELAAIKTLGMPSTLPGRHMHAGVRRPYNCL